MFGRVLSTSMGRVLGTLLVIGVSGSTVSYGTFASFTAQVTNTGSTFSTGTLVLSSKVAAGSVCYSTATGSALGTNTSDPSNNNNVNASCAAVFSLGNRKPGDAADLTELTIKNEGNLAGTLKLWASAACTSATASLTYDGGGNLCTVAQLTIQEYDVGFVTPGACIYGGTACAFDSTKTLADFGTSVASSTPITVGALNGSASRYFKIGIKLDSAAGNTMQGRQAGIAFTWNLS